jgi:hypothetical protein
MLAANSRMVDAALFESEKSIMSGWHEERAVLMTKCGL